MIDVSNFEEQVLEASREKPVLVDFWAPWCGPCRQLGPILEKLAEEPGAPFTLAKLNTDEDQTTAARYGIRSIPAVKLFVDGEVVDEFIGALPESQVRSWLSTAIPSETRRIIEDASEAIAAGETEQAEALLEEALTLDPANADAALPLAKLVLFKDPMRADKLAQTPGGAFEDVQAVRRIVALLEDESTDMPDDPARESYLMGVNALRSGDLDAALAGFVDSVRRNRRYHDDAARKTALALFNVLGDRHDLTRKHRRSLEMALF